MPRVMDHRRTAVAFTLVELLVVVAIIGLLAAILLPSLSRARELAKAATCLSNLHNTGLSIQMYTTENKFFPAAYSYIDGNSGSNGYYHWTAALKPDEYRLAPDSRKYTKTSNEYVCPSHDAGGWAPTNFTSVRIPEPPPGQASQDAGDTRDDRQAARLSYVVNEILMPRKKYSVAHDRANPPGTSSLRLVNADEVDPPSMTILLAEFSSSANCIWGSSVGGGAAYKSHRPTNGIRSMQAGGVFDGETYTAGTKIYKLTLPEAQSAIDAVLADKSAATSNHHISYINPAAHKSSSNYAFADGHAGRQTLEETLDPNNYMWGRKVYSCVDKPEIRITTRPRDNTQI